MPIAKYFSLALGAAVMPTEDEPHTRHGGFCPEMYETFVSQEQAERSIAAAWELDGMSYRMGESISLSQFAFRAYEESYDRFDKMSGVVRDIDISRAVFRKERLIRMGKYAVVGGTTGYLILKVLLIL